MEKRFEEKETERMANTYNTSQYQMNYVKNNNVNNPLLGNPNNFPENLNPKLNLENNMMATNFQGVNNILPQYNPPQKVNNNLNLNSNLNLNTNLKNPSNNQELVTNNNFLNQNESYHQYYQQKANLENLENKNMNQFLLAKQDKFLGIVGNNRANNNLQNLPIPSKGANQADNFSLNSNSNLYNIKRNANQSTSLDLVLLCNNLNPNEMIPVKSTEELMKRIQSFQISVDKEKPLINLNFCKYHKYFSLQFNPSRDNSFLDMSSRLISSIFLSMFLAIQNRSIENSDEKMTINYFLSTIQSLFLSEVPNVIEILRNPTTDLKNLITRIRTLEPKLVDLHILRTKYFITNQMQKIDIYTKLIQEMENTYKIPIDFLLIDEKGRMQRIKAGNFQSTIKAKLGINLEQGKNCVYFFLKNPNFESLNRESIKASMKQEEKEKLIQLFKDGQKAELKNGAHFLPIVEYFLSKGIDPSEICKYIINEFVDVSNQLLVLKNSQKANNPSDHNEDNIIIRVKECKKCNTKSKFISLPCEEYEEVNKEKEKDIYEKGKCLNCRKKIIDDFISFSQKTNKCKKCENSPHIDHLNVMKEILSYKNKNKNKNKNEITENSSESQDKNKNLKEDNPTSFDADQNQKYREGPPNFNPPWNKKIEEQKEYIQDLNNKAINKAEQENTSSKNSPLGENNAYQTESINKKNDSDSLSFQEKNKCLFCNSSDGKLILNDNCFKKGCKIYSYHKVCLEFDINEKVATNKKLSDIKCRFCKENFDYSKIHEIDPKSAKILRDRQYEYLTESLSGNTNKQQQDINHFSSPKNKCDIKHAHIYEDQEVIAGVFCPHEYFKVCFGDYLLNNWKHFKSISEVKCPVDNCNKFVHRQIIEKNFPDLAIKFKNP